MGLPDSGQLREEGGFLNDREGIIQRRVGPPVVEDPVIFHKPHGRAHPGTPQSLQQAPAHRGLGQRQHKMRLQRLHLGPDGLGHHLQKRIFQRHGLGGRQA